MSTAQQDTRPRWNSDSPAAALVRTEGELIAGDAILRLVNGARRSLNIVTIALNSDLHDYKAVARAVERRGVVVRIIVTSPALARRSRGLRQLQNRLHGDERLLVKAIAHRMSSEAVVADNQSFWIGDENSGRGTLFMNDAARARRLSSQIELTFERGLQMSPEPSSSSGRS